MPSFDVVSQVDRHEVNNAVDQANREVSTRFDFKGSQTSFNYHDPLITLKAENDFQLKQMLDILNAKLGKRDIDISCIKAEDPDLSGKIVQQDLTLRQGIDTSLAKQIVKMIKNCKIKVQTSIQGDQVRVTGKKRDDLQNIIQMLTDDKSIDLPLQYINFRD